MNKKIKSNRYKPESGENVASRINTGAGIDFCIKCVMIVAFISILSLASIFTFDFITQSALFNIKKIEISGTHRVLKEDLIKLAGLNAADNIFKINLFSIEQLIVSHPWIEKATVKRKLSSELFISVVEQKPLAIVKIENLADIIINTQGQPFKEYDPQKDRIEDLPVISGLDLTQRNDRYIFDGPLFNSIMNFFKIQGSTDVRKVTGNENTGIIIETVNIYNPLSLDEKGTIQIKLGFNNFKAKLNKAKKISEYIDKYYPTRTICAMDFFNIEKVFVKTKLNDALHNNLEKGV